MDDAEREELDLRAREVELQRTRLIFEMDAERERQAVARTQAVAAARQAGTAIVAILVTLVISMWAQVTASSTAERTLTTQVGMARDQLRHDSEQFLQQQRRRAYLELVRRARAERVAFRNAQLFAEEQGQLPDGFETEDVVALYESAQGAAVDARLVGKPETSELARQVGQLCWELRVLAMALLDDPGSARHPDWDSATRELGNRTRDFLDHGRDELLKDTVLVASQG